MKLGVLLSALFLLVSVAAQAQKVTYTCVDLKNGTVGLRMWVWGSDGYPTNESRYLSTYPMEIEPGSGSRDGLSECRAIAKHLNENKPRD